MVIAFIPFLARDLEKECILPSLSGLCPFFLLFPALKRWAIFKSGTNIMSRVSENAQYFVRTSLFVFVFARVGRLTIRSAIFLLWNEVSHRNMTPMRPHHEAIRPTTIIEAPRLSKRLGARVVIASETFQWTGSFKFRAAYNVALNVPNEHIIGASSGNFGQALAYACQLTGKRCTVVMPHDSARVKVEAVRDYGATVDLINVREISRSERVQQLAGGIRQGLYRERLRRPARHRG